MPDHVERSVKRINQHPAMGNVPAHDRVFEMWSGPWPWHGSRGRLAGTLEHLGMGHRHQGYKFLQGIPACAAWQSAGILKCGPVPCP